MIDTETKTGISRIWMTSTKIASSHIRSVLHTTRRPQRAPNLDKIQNALWIRAIQQLRQLFQSHDPTPT